MGNANSSMETALSIDGILECILGHLSMETGNMKHMLVCRRWAELSRYSQRALRLRRTLTARQIEDALRVYRREGAFPRLTVLSLNVERITNDFIAFCGSSSKLETLCIRLMCPAENGDFSTDAAYRRLFKSNPGLRSIDICHHFDSAPRSLMRLRHLKVLTMHCSEATEEIMEVLTTSAPLETVDLRRSSWSPIVAIPSGITQLRSLHSLRIGAFIATLPPSFASLSQLQSLDVVIYGHAMPPEIASLPNLQHLVDIGPNLRNPPSGPISLRTLDLSIGSDMSSLNGLSSLARFERLWINASIEERPNIQSIPPSLSSLVNLRQLEIRSMTSLQCLGGIGSLTGHQELIVRHCNVREVPSGLSSLTDLRALTLQEFPRLRSISEEISSLRKLRTFHIRSCPCLKQLPGAFRRLRLDDRSRRLIEPLLPDPLLKKDICTLLSLQHILGHIEIRISPTEEGVSVGNVRTVSVSL